MFRRAVSVILAVVLLPSLVGGCNTMTTEKIAPAQFHPSGGRPIKGILSGLTKKDGQEVRFDEGARARVWRDSVFAVVSGAPVAYPLTDVAQLWIYKRSGEKEAIRAMGIIGGMAAFGILVGAILIEIT
jgi:hypothetical protein